jgi:hypothetical protein
VEEDFQTGQGLPVSTSTRSGPGPPGIAGSPWPCSCWPSSPSPPWPNTPIGRRLGWSRSPATRSPGLLAARQAGQATRSGTGCAGQPGGAATSAPHRPAPPAASRSSPIASRSSPIEGNDLRPDYHERGSTRTPPGAGGFMDGDALAGKAGGAPAARAQATAVYALGRDREESARLRQQSAKCGPTAPGCSTGRG